MGFGRRRNGRHGWKRDNRKKMGLGKKIRLLGLVVVLVGIVILALNKDTHSQTFIISFALIVIGMVMIAGKRIFEKSCNCCKCTNCGLNHNHWTHD